MRSQRGKRCGARDRGHRPAEKGTDRFQGTNRQAEAQENGLSPTEDQRDDEENQEDEHENLRDPCRSTRNAPESEDRGNDRDDKEQ